MWAEPPSSLTPASTFLTFFLVFGVWWVVFGVSRLVFGVWGLVSGAWCLLFSVWSLVSGLSGFNFALLASGL